MKKLTYSAMATARLRANKKQYLSLILGIFLSIFLVTSLVMGIYGIFLAQEARRVEKIGYLDMVVLERTGLDDAALDKLGLFDELGHAYISGQLLEQNLSLGWYDEAALSLLDLKPLEGRMPEKAGEIALEKTAMNVLGVQWSLGETVELTITPVDGVEESRSFTVVGFLPERSVYLDYRESYTTYEGLGQCPAILTSAEEPPFQVGRVGDQRLLGLADGVSLNKAIETLEGTVVGELCIFGLDASGEQQLFAARTALGKLGKLIDGSGDIMGLVIGALMLGGALILSCGVGISGAMEGLLSGRREEIGVLRALGATRRQIRQIFGRENLLLALVVSPLSMGIGCLIAWVLSWLMPQSMIFGFNLWLLLPIGVFSVVVILLSGYLPLNRASKLMPMSVIRDTAMLRRNKKVKTKQVFSPTRLIASRQIRFNPTRQIGAALLVGLMLLCSGLFAGMSTSFTRYLVADSAAFELRTNGYSFQSYISIYDTVPMSDQNIAQLKKLNHVKYVEPERRMQVMLLLENVPRYAASATFNNIGMLDGELLEEARKVKAFMGEHFDSYIDQAQNDYQQFRTQYGIDSHAYSTTLLTVDLSKASTVEALEVALQSGKIDVDAINRGEQVLITAPNVWIQYRKDNSGYRTKYSQSATDKGPTDPKYQLVAWNDSFEPGQSLPILQLYRTEYDGPVTRNEDTVTVGGVLHCVNSLSVPTQEVTIITTEQGLANMTLDPQGLGGLAVYLDGELTLEEEEVLASQIEAINRRADGFTLYNRMEQARKNERTSRQAILLVSSMAVLFFAVAVGMIVSSVTRQLNSEGRTIGMLRAVGADEKAILGCYSGQINASVAGGLGISLLLLLVYAGMYILDGLSSEYSPTSQEFRMFGNMAVTACIMAAGCYLSCRAILRLRIKKIVSKSIIENIREL